MSKTTSSLCRIVVVNNIEEATSGSVMGVEERECPHCHYQYYCCSIAGAGVDGDEQQQQQQHDCIDVHIPPYPTALAC